MRERCDLGVDRRSLSDDAKNGRGARERAAPEIDYLRDQAARVELTFGLLSHELGHRHGRARSRAGEIEHARENVALRTDRVVDGLHSNAGLPTSPDTSST